MNHLKVGIRLEALGLPLRRALREAQRLGVRGVQADAAGDWLAPVPLFVSTAVFIFFRNRPEYPLVATVMFIAMIAVLRYAVLYGNRARMRVVASGQRRLFLSTALGNIIGMILVLLGPLAGPRSGGPSGCYPGAPLRL